MVDFKKKKQFKRKYGRTDDHERKAMPILCDSVRQQLLVDSRMGFVNTIIKNFNNTLKPEDIVDEARVYYKRRYDDDLSRGKPRPSHWLNSASTALTAIKAQLKASTLATYTFRREVALTKKELLKLDRINHRRLEQRIHSQPEINLTKLLTKLYELLESQEPDEIFLGIAGLTGRRQTEVVYSMLLAEPQNSLRHRYPTFWAHVTGFSKKKKHDRYAVRARELPLLAPRTALVEAIREARAQWPSDSHEEASGLYSSKMAAAHKKHLKPLGVRCMHDLRKTFAQLAYNYFNERGSVLPAFASTVLGQETAVKENYDISHH